MIQGQTINVALNPLGAKQLRESESFYPANLELRNGVRTDAGFFKGRPGYTSKWSVGVAQPMMLLIPRKWSTGGRVTGRGFGVTENGRLFELLSDDSVQEFTGNTLNGVFRPTWCEFDGRLIIVDGQAPIKVDPAGTTTSLLGGSPPAAKYCAVIADRVVLAGHDETLFRWSDPGSSEIWPAGNQSEVTGHGEVIRNLMVANQDLYFFKDFTIEVWAHIGGQEVFGRRLMVTVGDKFSRNRGVPSFSVVQGPDGFYFFCESHFWKLTGAQAQILSFPYQRELAGLVDVDSMYGFHCQKEHLIRWFEPVSGRCFVYDYVNDNFTEDNGVSGGEFTRLPVYSYMEVDGVAYVGDYNPTGNVYRWGDDLYTDNGTAIKLSRRFRVPLSQNGHKAKLTRLRLRMQRGSGGSTAVTENMLVRWSFDEGAYSPYAELAIGNDGDGDPYVDVIHPVSGSRTLGIGRDVKLELTQQVGVPHLLTHANLTVKELGR